MRRISLFVRGAVVCLLSVVFTIAVHAQEDKVSEGALRLLNKERQESGFCPLKRTDVRADVSGFVARLTVTQTFQNPLPDAIEAVYTFPLPNDAAVNDMTIQIGDRIIRGLILERKNAQETYDKAKQEGKTAALLIQQRPGVFTQFVGNITPNAEIRVMISYVETLPYVDDTYQFTFPMTVGPRTVQANPETGDVANVVPPSTTRPGHMISMEINVDSGVPVVGVDSATHEIETIPHDTSKFTVRLKDGDVIPNRDFVLKYKTAGTRIADAVLAHHDGRGGYFTLILQPPDNVMPSDTTPKEVVFVLDTSGSMSGFPIEKARETMDLTLAHLNPSDTFNLITFAGETSILFPSPVPATRENLERARKMLAQASSGGGTEMMKAIKAALDPSDAQGHMRITCFLTDGVVGNEAEIIKEIKSHPNARVFAFGVGSINRPFLDEITRQGRGDVEYVMRNDDGSAAAKRFFERIRNPLLTDISVEYQGVIVSDTYPARIPDLFDAKPVTVTGRYAQGGRGKIVLRGTLQGQAFSREIDVDLPTSSGTNEVLATLWARRKIADLVGQDPSQKDDAITRAITALGLEYRLLTSFTAMVAVDETPATDGAPPVRIVVPEPVVETFGMGAGYSASVNVTSNASISNTTGNTITTTRVYTELPVNGGSHQALLSIAPGITQVAGSQSGQQRGLISSNGQKAASNQFNVDGFDANRGISSPGSPIGVLPELTAAGGTNTLLPFDATEEVVVNSFAMAGNSRVAGGTIKLVSKGGSNQYHGSLFEIFGNGALNVGDPFARAIGLEKAPSRLNIFGGSLGGYLVKDRAFFFLNYEGARIRQGSFSFSEVPGTAARLAAPPGLRTVFGAFPVANGPATTDGFAQFASVFTSPATHDIAGERLDVVLSNSTHLTARHNFARSSAIWRGDRGLSLNSLRYLDTSSNSFYTVVKHSLTSSIVIGGHGSYGRSETRDRQAVDNFGGATVPASLRESSLKYDLAGRTALATGGRTRSTIDEFQTIGRVDMITAGHEFGFGVDLRRIAFDIEPQAAERNVLFRDLDPAGIAARINEISRTRVSGSVNNLSVYAQDSYRVTPSLTLEFGVRWDKDFTPDRETPVISIQNASASINGRAGNVAPRFGVALDPTGNGRTAFRFSAGRFFDFGNYDAADAILSSYPSANGRFVRNVHFSTTPSVSLRPLRVFASNLATPSTWQILGSYEQELARHVKFLASHTAAFGTDQLLSRTLLGADPVFNVLNFTDNSGVSRYNALTLSLYHRSANNFSFNARYTLSEATDNHSPGTIVNLQFVADQAGEKGPSDFDARHTVVASGQFDIPTPFERRAARWLLSDWTFFANMNARSGLPIDVTYAQVNDLGLVHFRPDLLSGSSPYGAAADPRTLNTSAFVVPGDIRQGSLGRNSLRGSMFFQLNGGLQKRFKLGGDASLQFKAEALNLLNNVNFENPDGRLGTRFQDGTFMPNYYFGKTAVTFGSNGFTPLYLYGGPRTIQFSAKFIF